MDDSTKEAWAHSQRTTVRVPHFLHHLRILVVLIPCWLIILSISGRTMLSTLGFFGAIASLLYSIRLYNLSLLSLVIGITLCNVLQLLVGSSLTSSSPMFGLLLISNTFIMALTGGYLALLFPYIYEDESLKGVAALTEKLLFSVFPLLASSLLTWSAINNFGIQNGAFWLLLLQIVNYLLFALPQKSSFSKLEGKEDKDDQPVTSDERTWRESPMIGGLRLDELVCDAMMSRFQFAQLFMPLGLHLATYWRSLFLVLPATFGEMTHLADILILALIPTLLLGLLGTIGRYNPLWWTQQKHENGYKLFMLVSVLVLVPCFEFRVIYFAFDSLFSGLPAPYNYVALTLAVYAFILSITLHLRSGNAPPSAHAGEFRSFNALVATQMVQARKISYVLAVFCALMISLALGVPIYLWPAPILAALAFISFYFERQWWMYVAFVSGLELGLIWFVYKSFFGLNFRFFTLAGWISIQVACVLVVCMAAMAALITGLIILGLFEKWTNLLLILHASLLAIMEEVLHMEQLTNDFDIYPAYLVVITTVFGVLMARKLRNDGRINTNVLFVVSMIYLSKLALLLKPVSWPTISAMMLLSPPLYLVFKLWDAQHVLVDASKSNSICAMYVTAVFVGSMFNRWTLFQRLLEILVGELHDHASPALVHGISFVLFGALLPPLAWHHPYKSEHDAGNAFSTRRRRIISFSGFAIIAVGFAAMASQQLFGSSPTQQMLGSGVMSTILGTRSGLPLISTLGLIALVLIVVLIWTGTIDYTHSARQRVMTSMAIGLAVGAFLGPFALSTSISGIHVLPEESSPVFVTLGICCTFQLVAVIIAFSDWHSISQDAKLARFAPRFGPAAYAFLWLQWPLMFLSMVMLSLISGVSRMDELQSYNQALIAIQAFSQGIIALVLKVLEPNKDDAHHSTRAEWIPDIANIATILCFGLSTVVALSVGSRPIALVLLSPILLLLQRSGRFASVIPRNPYCHVYLAAAATLFGMGQIQLWLSGPFRIFSSLLSIALPFLEISSGFPDWLSFLQEVLAQATLLPSMIVTAVWLWTLKPATFAINATAAWLAVATYFFTDIPAISILALSNMILTVAQLLIVWAKTVPESSRSPLST